MNRVTILGVGNYLMGDEGVGVHFANMLEKEDLPDGIRVVEGGAGGFKLMEFLDDGAHVVLVDATLDHHPAGTIRHIVPKFAADFPKAMSTHEIGLKDLVESLMLLGRLPPIHLFVVTIPSIQPVSIELSDEVRACLPELRRQVIAMSMELLGSAETWALPN